MHLPDGFYVTFQVVLTRQMDGEELHDTYYVYDSFGNLRAVLPPMVQDKLTSGDNLNQDHSVLRDYAYLYKYDNRNRCTWKKLPGCDPVEYKYDHADRMIFSRDGEQRDNQEWTFYLYDAFGRLAVQGICADASIPGMGELVVKAQFGGSGYPVGETGYNCNVNIPAKSLAQVNYYDNYNLISQISGFGSDYAHTSECTTPKGLLTGSITYTQGDTPQSLCSAVYYDMRANPVKTIAGNHLGGMEITTTTYTFTNNPKTVEHIHTKDSKGGGQETLNSIYDYDHANRLTKASHTLSGAGTVTIVNTYNELGQLEKRTYNGISGLQEEYAYNIRSWLTRLNGKNFKSELEYTDNGNIASMDWGKGALDRKYNYFYDGLSRLDSAVFSKDGIKGDYNTTYEYDKHGNILTLQRHGKTDASAYGLIDRLSMGYAGNQLTSLSEMVSGITLPESNDLKVSSTYAYNKNGAMTKDSGKNITDISYNSLNLPRQLTINGKTNYYLYAWDGRKLQVKQGDFTRDYVGSFVYENDTLKRVFFEGGYWEDKKPYFYFNDHLGNVRAVADEAGEPVQINDYYPFGLPMAETGNDEQDVQPYKFGGKEFDRTDGLNLYDFSARQLDAGIGRFTSVDPLAEKYYGWSPYAYVMNNPMRLIDPTGMDVWEMDYDGRVRWISKSDEHTMYALGEDGQRTGNSITLEDRSIFDNLTATGKESDYNKTFSGGNPSDLASVFLFGADNSNVEWRFSRYNQGNGSQYAIGTAHENSRAINPEQMGFSRDSEVAFIHSHPGEFNKTVDEYQSMGWRIPSNQEADNRRWTRNEPVLDTSGDAFKQTLYGNNYYNYVYFPSNGNIYQPRGYKTPALIRNIKGHNNNPRRLFWGVLNGK